MTSPLTYRRVGAAEFMPRLLGPAWARRAAFIAAHKRAWDTMRKALEKVSADLKK